MRYINYKSQKSKQIHKNLELLNQKMNLIKHKVKDKELVINYKQVY